MSKQSKQQGKKKGIKPRKAWILRHFDGTILHELYLFKPNEKIVKCYQEMGWKFIAVLITPLSVGKGKKK
jgi:hypothetical protein